NMSTLLPVSSGIICVYFVLVMLVHVIVDRDCQLHFLILIMIRRTTLSTLFPYTTLFRSGFLTASKQFRHGATSKSRSNTASNSTKHKSPHLSGWRQIISLIT